MDFFHNIVFCKDSVLRVEFYKNGKPVFIPLENLQKTQNKDDLFILSWINSGFLVEEGTTLSNVIIALKPWFRVLDPLLGRDLSLFLKASYSISEEKQYYDFLELVTVFYLYRPASEHKSLFTKRIIKKPDDVFRLDNSCEFVGVKNDDLERYTLSGVSFNAIKNTPINVINQSKFCVCNFGAELISKDYPGVEHTEKYNQAVFFSEEKLSILSALNAIFHNGLFFDTPFTIDSENALTDSIKERVEDSDSTENENALGNDTKKKVVFTDDALDDIASVIGDEIDNSERILDTISFDNVKIGNIKYSEKNHREYIDKKTRKPE